MKKFLIILSVSLLIMLGFAGCRRQPAYRIGVSQCSDDDWRLMMNEQIEREMMFHPEARVEIRSASDDSRRQIEDIRYFIDNKFDIIIAAPNEAGALTPVIAEAYESGIPVLVFDRSVDGDKFTAFQGADNAGIGAMAGRYASSLLPSGGEIIELEGLMSSTPAAERGRGFHRVVDSIGNGLRIAASVDAGWNYDRAYRATDSLLSIYPHAALIYAHNDRMALGASDAAASKGLHPYIIGIDAAPSIGMEAVKEGKIDATFLYPAEGQQLVQTALAILNGEPYEKNLLIPAAPAIDKENVELLLRQTDIANSETAHMKELKEEVDDYWNEHNSQKSFLYALVVVLLLVCVILFLVLRTFWQSRRHHAELLEKNRLLQEQRDLEKQLNRQLEEATQSKLTFFTNVSHDLRTPLTLIADPVEQVAKAPNLTPQQRTLMQIADKNVKILKRLINRILDFRKYENGKLPLNLEEASPAALGKDWAEAFYPLAHKKHIDYAMDFDLPEGFTMAIDMDKIERVVFNLLSNAFKFTPVKGKVSLTMRLDGDSLVVSVADTGRGIPAENLPNIFDHFYQVEKVRPEGSGIGLSLTKAFVEVHGGSISVESEEGKGTVFTFTLPVTHTGRQASQEALLASRESAKAMSELLGDTSPLPEIRDEYDGRPLVLVIDDNADVRLLIKEQLGEQYQVVGAADGKEGIRLAARYVPDAIVCDVMMPGIDGMETCKAIKEEMSTSHIPVLMLTACSLDEQRVEGYESGADGYMAKPFGSDVLRARIASLIANRRRLMQHGAPVPAPESAAKPGEPAREPAKKDMENEFYTRFATIVNEEMGNMELSVDALADRMGMGRSQVYRKLKALTGLSPVELLRDMRLKKARELLLTTDKTISEIAYEVGFSTPAYFTKCYREVYSETPSALRERMKG